MKRRNNRSLGFGILVFFITVGFGLTSLPSTNAQLRLTFSTSPMGGTWYPMAAGLAELFNNKIQGLTVTVDGSGGAAVNPRKLATKEVQMSMTTLDMIFAAREGTRPFKEKLDLSDARSIILQHSSPSHWVVLKKSPIKTLKDLKGKKLAIGERGAAGNTRVLWFLDAAGLTRDDVNLEYIGDDQAATALGDGRIDAMVEFVGVPAAFALNLGATAEIRFLGLTKEEEAKLRKSWPYMVPTVIKAGTYPKQTEDFVGFGVTGCLMVLKTVPDDIVYQMCKIIDGNWDHLLKVHQSFQFWRFDKDIDSISGQPVHTGALKFYKEKGLIK
ncbi:MAG: TAXI family TRAP transporter solute-binding subunit [Thermodesulfobacteriota bacterium]|nr:TAXI family TRAP transporter solute-binding subunit [Thermodesulfobacteriota bacterium]